MVKPRTCGLAAACLLALASAARAAPMVSPLPYVVDQSSAIVIGTLQYAPPGFTVQVERVVRGPVKPGPLAVKPSPDGHITIDRERVVAFIDQGGALRWVGRLAGGPSLERGVIRLQGFFDRNAHLVRPGILTLAQLEEFAKSRTLKQKLVATLAFGDGKGGVRPAPGRRFTIDYDPLLGAVRVSGLDLACLDAPPRLQLEWGDPELSLDGKCESADGKVRRQLEFSGRYTGVDDGGAITLELFPDRPLLTEEEYDRFARDPAILDVTRVVRVELPGGEAWSWRVGESLVDPSGKVHPAGGVSSTLGERGGKQYTEETMRFGSASITLEPESEPGAPGGHPRGLTALLQSGKPVRCTFSRKGQGKLACKLREVEPRIVRK